MKIAFISPEVYPFVKTGGLGDVANSIPRALKKRGHDVIIILPHYKVINKNKFELEKEKSILTVPFLNENKSALIYSTSYLSYIKTYLINNSTYFGGDTVYDDVYNYDNNLERYAFFSRAALGFLKDIHFSPDIIHCNDWHTSLIPVYKKLYFSNDPFFSDTKILMSIHNAGYQGIFENYDPEIFGLNCKNHIDHDIENNKKVNLLKYGVLYSDIVTTVSKNYASEIQTEEYGYEIAGIFKEIKDRLFGITNAFDDEQWNPAIDKYIPSTYSLSDISGKVNCKLKLQEQYKFKVDKDIPIIGTISRLTHQKGIDVLLKALELLLQDDDFQFLMIGNGDFEFIKQCETLKNLFSERVGVFWGYSEELAHLAHAGLDILIMPSRYEPCGLSQMYSLKYGTIPIVRATGGLDDIIEEWDRNTNKGNGFKFDKLNSNEIYNCVRNVLRKYKNKDEWNTLQKNAMHFNYTWDEAILEYEKVYNIVKGK